MISKLVLRCGSLCFFLPFALMAQTRDTGSLRVTILPAEANLAGANWLLPDGSSQSSGAAVGNLAVGPLKISFGQLAGWSRPDEITVTIISRTLTEVSATYRTLTAAPAISRHPEGVVVNRGQPIRLSAQATGEALSFLWFKDGVSISGADRAEYLVPAARIEDSGSYWVVVSNVAGFTTSRPASVVVNEPTAPPPVTRLSGVSVRTTLAANQILIVGVNVAGGSRPALIRAAGPGLGALGVPGTMADPRLALFNGQTQVAANDDWAGNPVVASAISSLGAFPFPSATSRDAALVSNIEGGRTVQVSGPAAGNLIVEVYDAGSGDSPRLTSVSALNRVGTGGDILIAGFTLVGSGTRNLLIRGVGPSLGAAPFNLTGVLANPKLDLFTAAAVPVRIGGNDDYASSLAPVFASVGAFALVPSSRDAAFIVNLPPGGYTVQVSGADGGTGTAIVEIYELP